MVLPEPKKPVMIVMGMGFDVIAGERWGLVGDETADRGDETGGRDDEGGDWKMRVEEKRGMKMEMMVMVMMIGGREMRDGELQ